MKIKELLQKYVATGVAISFDSLYSLAKIKGYYSNETDFEIDLENAITNGLVGCTIIQNQNRFFAK